MSIYLGTLTAASGTDEPEWHRLWETGSSAAVQEQSFQNPRNRRWHRRA